MHMSEAIIFPEFDRRNGRKWGERIFDPEGDNLYEYSFVVLDKVEINISAACNDGEA